MLNAEHVARDATKALPLLGEMERAFAERMAHHMANRKFINPRAIKKLNAEFNRTLTSLRMNFRALSTTRNLTFIAQIEDDMKQLAVLVTDLDKMR